MLTAALFTEAKRRGQARCPLAKERISGCGLSTQRNDDLIHATTWKDLETIVLRERSLTQKVTCFITPCQCNAQVKRQRQEAAEWWPGAGGGCKGEQLFNGGGVCFGGW